jgi:transcription elongation factor GreA
MSQELTETWLTTEAFERRTAELEHLTGEGRSEIAKKIEAAREEGDLKENGGYHAAKDEQGKIEARIRVLTELLRHAKVGDAPENTDVVASGTVVTAKIMGDKEVFLIGSREIVDENDTDDLDVWSERSPLGEAIMGHKVGDKTSYVAPNGKEIKVEIVSVAPYRVS